jgi:hypothetical protein
MLLRVNIELVRPCGETFLILSLKGLDIRVSGRVTREFWPFMMLSSPDYFPALGIG